MRERIEGKESQRWIVMVGATAEGEEQATREENPVT